MPKNDDVATHEIIDTLLAKCRRSAVHDRPPLLKGQVLDGTPIEKVAQRQTILGQCLECRFIERDESSRLQSDRIKLTPGNLQQFVCAEVFTGTDRADR